MKQTLIVEGRLPGTNEYIDACRTHRKAGAKMKRQAQDHIGWCIRQCRMRPMAGKVNVSIEWVEPNMRRDKDNIQGGIKFILDALVECGILGNDNWTWIGDIAHRCSVNKAAPRVIVKLEEV